MWTEAFICPINISFSNRVAPLHFTHSPFPLYTQIFSYEIVFALATLIENIRRSRRLSSLDSIRLSSIMYSGQCPKIVRVVQRVLALPCSWKSSVFIVRVERNRRSVRCRLITYFILAVFNECGNRMCVCVSECVKPVHPILHFIITIIFARSRRVSYMQSMMSWWKLTKELVRHAVFTCFEFASRNRQKL